MNIAKRFGKNLKNIREKREFTQEQLAELVEISPSSLSRIERGLSYPKPLTLERIANALNIKPHLLYLNSERDFNCEQGYKEICEWLERIKNDRVSLIIVYDFLKEFFETL